MSSPASTPRPTPRRSARPLEAEPPSGPLRAASVVAGVGALATALLAVGHAGVEVPLLSAIGPGGGRAVWPAATAFSVAALGYCVIAAGLARERSWAVALGAVVFGVTVIGALLPYRGPASAAGAVLGATGLCLLSLPALRRWRGRVGRSPDRRRRAR